MSLPLRAGRSWSLRLAAGGSGPPAGHGSRTLSAALALALLSASAWAGPIGTVQQVAGAGCRFPDAAFDPAGRRYLVVWVDYGAKAVFGRLLTDEGVPSGAAFRISTGTVSLYPSVTFNPTRGEFFVVWEDEERANPVYGQRVRASDGAPVGANLPLAATATGSHAAVAWSETSARYLVVFQDPVGLDIHGRILDGDGVPVGGDVSVCQDAAYSGYPTVAWDSANDRFLAVWDHDVNNVGDAWAQRLDPTGARVGGPIAVTSTGKANRPNAAFDPSSARFLVAYNDVSRAGNSYDQSGTFVRADGAVDGAAVPLAATTLFEGDTLLGGDLAYAPKTRRFFSSFTTSVGMGGQEVDAAGARVGAQADLARGDFGALTNAADTERDRFLTAWEDLASSNGIYARVYEVVCAPSCAGQACGADDGCGGKCPGCDGGAGPDAAPGPGPDASAATDAASPADAVPPSPGEDARPAPGADGGFGDARSTPADVAGSCGCAASGSSGPLAGLLAALGGLLRPFRRRRGRVEPTRQGCFD